MKAKQILLVLFILLLVIISCKKEEETGGNHHYNLSESLYPMLFNKGSYWIYRNIDSTIIDSVSLVEIVMDTIGPSNVGNGFSITAEVYNINYFSSLNGKYSEQYVGYIISRGSTDGGYVYLSSFKIGDSSVNAKIAAIHESLLVNGILYKNVVEMDIKKDMYIENDMNLFYVDSIGLIKKEIKEGSNIIDIWALLKYNIKLYEN